MDAFRPPTCASPPVFGTPSSLGSTVHPGTYPHSSTVHGIAIAIVLLCSSLLSSRIWLYLSLSTLLS